MAHGDTQEDWVRRVIFHGSIPLFARERDACREYLVRFPRPARQGHVI